MSADGDSPVRPETDPPDQPSLHDVIRYFARIEAEEKDCQLRADLIAAGINVPATDQDED